MNSEEKIKRIYFLGAVTTSIVICLTLLDIIIGSIAGGDLSMIPQSAVDKFIQLQENKWLGLYNLDLLNLVVSVIMIPGFLALYFALKNEDSSFALLSLITFTIGTTVFISNNSALPMLDLSQKYFSATTEDQSIFFAAGAEALIAKGAHGSFGVFPGFILITLSEVFISFLMLQTRIFSKATSYIGISGTILLLIYLIIVTFVPSAKPIAIILAGPGGILSLIWMIMFSIKLFKLAK
jgi:drug/metabolite transporter superfamily protein YnfA